MDTSPSPFHLPKVVMSGGARRSLSGKAGNGVKEIHPGGQRFSFKGLCSVHTAHLSHFTLPCVSVHLSRATKQGTPVEDTQLLPSHPVCSVSLKELLSEVH